MTETIEQKLDRLAEFYSQKDSLDAKKQALLNEVKVPAEVLEVQKQANADMSKIDAEDRAALEVVRSEFRALLDSIVIPEEIKAALIEIDRQRAEVSFRQRDREMELQSINVARRQAIFEASQAKTAHVFADLEKRKREIGAEFAGKLDAVDENIKALELEIKGEVKACGKSVKGDYFHAVYVKGRVTWNTDMLDGMVIAVPELARARKEGEPSVTLRKI